MRVILFVHFHKKSSHSRMYIPNNISMKGVVLTMFILSDMLGIPQDIICDIFSSNENGVFLFFFP